MFRTSSKHPGHEHPRPCSVAVVAQLSALGCRDTDPRRLAIRAVAARGRPFTAEELCASLPCFGRATAYGGLRLLVETSRVCRAPLEDHELRYQLSYRGHHHHLLRGECVDD